MQLDLPPDRILEVGSKMENINIMKDCDDPVVGKDDEYPSWIWNELDISRKGGFNSPPPEKNYWRRPPNGDIGGDNNEERLLMIKDPSNEWNREEIRSCNKDRIKYNNALRAKK